MSTEVSRMYGGEEPNGAVEYVKSIGHTLEGIDGFGLTAILGYQALHLTSNLIHEAVDLPRKIGGLINKVMG